MNNLFAKFWPVLFILGVWFIFASPYFLKGKVPYPSTYQVNHFPPWSSYENFWGPVKNGAMPDIIDQIYPWKHFTIETFKKGEFPFWNPYSFSGNPHLANYQSAVLSPFNLLFFALPFIDAWAIIVLLQPLLAGLFMYLLLRQFKVSEHGCVLSSVSFMFCGFMVVWMAYGTLAMAIAFLPVTLFAIEKIFHKPNFIWALLFSICLPLSFFSGHFQTSLYFIIFTSLFLFYKILATRNIRSIRIAILSFIVGIVVSFLQIIPSIQLYLQSVRSEVFLSGGGIPLYYLTTIFSPDFFGNPVTRNDWIGSYAEWSGFIGIIPFVFAIFAVLEKRSVVRFFLIMGITALLLAINSPLQNVIGFLKIPVLSTSNPTRIIVLFSFSFAVLAGFGLDTMREFLKKKDLKKLSIPVLFTGFFIFLTWFLLLIVRVMPVDKIVLAERNLILPTLLFIGTFAVVLFSRWRKEFVMLFIFCLLLASAFDSLRNASKWMPFDQRELVYPETTVINAIKNNIGEGRIFGNLGAETSVYYGFPLIEGYDPLYIGRYGEFVRGASGGDYLPGERSVVRVDRRGKYTNELLDLLGVSLIFHPVGDTNQGWAFPVWEDKNRFSLVYREDKFQLFKNNFAMPRAALFYDYEVIKDSPSIIKRIYSDSFDFRKKLIVEEEPEQSIKEGTGTAKIMQFTQNTTTIKVKTTGPALLFLSDNYYPAFQASVNGQKTKIFRADYTFRAVVVPGGESKVVFSFLPGRFK